MTIHDMLNNDDAYADMAIGSVCWFTISNVHITPDDLGNLLDRVGLSRDHLPGELNELDAYKRATGAAKTEYSVGLDTARVMIRAVDTEPHLVTRHIVRELVDPSGKRLSYETIGQALFHRPGDKEGGSSGHMQVDINENGQGEEAAALALFGQQIESTYELARTHYGPSAIRSLVRNLVLGMNAICIRPSGGVYFVNRDHSAELKAVKALVKALPGNTMLHTLPLVDSAEQRGMLAQAFSEEVETEVSDLLEEISKVSEKYDGEEIPSRTFTVLTDRLADALDRAAEHDRTLALVNERSTAALQMVQESLTALAGRVRQPKRKKAA